MVVNYVVCTLTYNYVYKKELIIACANGIQFTCAGLFCGEVMLSASQDSKAIDIVLRAKHPDLQLVMEIFSNLIKEEFPKCITYLTVKFPEFFLLFSRCKFSAKNIVSYVHFPILYNPKKDHV